VNKFLKTKFTDLHTSPEVKSAAERTEKRTGKKVGTKPADLIENYLERFREILDREDSAERDRGIKAIKRKMHELHVIKPDEVPKSYFEHQKKIVREQGYGDIEITNETRNQLTEVIITDQSSTMDKWINYLTSSDANVYPDWLKYWAFRSMLKLSSYDKKKKAFGKRKKDTVAPFPDLNQEALSYVVDIIEKKVNKIPIYAHGGYDEQTEYMKAIEGANFGKLYAYAIENVTPTEENELEKTAGEWVCYKQESDHMPLVKSLQGHGTGWCTAGESTAEAQLKTGDFHVYYTYDKNGEPIIPRVAIRMEGSQIAEVRGVAPDQNLDPYIGDVAEKKLQEFPDGPKYKKKAHDMKLLTEIDKKYKADKELSKEELTFLYEIDGKIEGFGYEDDPRVEEIKKDRNKKRDYSNIYNIEERYIIDNNRNLDENTKISFDKIPYRAPSNASFEEVERLSAIIGLNCNLTKIDQSIKDKLTKFEGNLADRSEQASYPNLKTVKGQIVADSTTTFQANALQSVGGDLYANKSTTFQVNALQSVGGTLDAPSATTFQVNALQSVGGTLNANKATTFQANALQSVGGDLYANKSTTFQANSLQSVGRELNADSTTTFQVNALQNVGERLDVENATTFQADALQNVGETLNAKSAKTFQANSLQSVGGDLNASIAKTFQVNALESVNGGLYVNNVKIFHINGLKSVGGTILANNAKTFQADNLQSVGRHIYARKVTTFQANALQSVGGNLDAPSATTFQVNALESVDGDIDAQSATTFEAGVLESVDEILLDKTKTEEIDIPEETKEKIEYV
jgi:hypothetical protein